MSKVARAFAMLLVAVFAVTAVAQAVDTATVGVAMALAGASDSGSGSCKSCADDDRASPGCETTCVAPSVMAAPAMLVAVPVAFVAPYDTTFDGRGAGVSSAPDPNPPRAFIPA